MDALIGNPLGIALLIAVALVLASGLAVVWVTWESRRDLEEWRRHDAAERERRP